MRTPTSSRPCTSEPPRRCWRNSPTWGRKRPREVVIANPRKIADQVEDGLTPVPQAPQGRGYLPALLARRRGRHSQHVLRARPQDRTAIPCRTLWSSALDKELGSIIGYGFSTLYNIAERLVKQVPGRRIPGGQPRFGGVLASWPACAGITEVNALPPHYRLPPLPAQRLFDVDKSTVQLRRGPAGQGLPRVRTPPGEGRLRHPL